MDRYQPHRNTHTLEQNVRILNADINHVDQKVDALTLDVAKRVVTQIEKWLSNEWKYER